MKSQFNDDNIVLPLNSPFPQLKLALKEKQHKGTKAMLSSLTLMSSFDGPEAIMLSAKDTKREKRFLPARK